MVLTWSSAALSVSSCPQHVLMSSSQQGSRLLCRTEAPPTDRTPPLSAPAVPETWLLLGNRRGSGVVPVAVLNVSGPSGPNGAEADQLVQVPARARDPRLDL